MEKKTWKAPTFRVRDKIFAKVPTGRRAWNEVGELVHRNFRMTAPKRLVRALPDKL